MKTYKTILLAASLAGLLVSTTARSADAPAIPAPLGTPDAAARPGVPNLPPPSGAGETRPAGTGLEQALPKPPEVPRPGSGTNDGLRLNFRDVPLEQVLNFLSDAAGFIIVMQTKVEGRINVWSNQEMTRDEAVELLDSVLNKNGYAAVRRGRTLTIMSREDAKKFDIPVKRGGDADPIPHTEEMVTQIIPVKHAIASQLTANLMPLLGTYAEMTPNESANSLIITATQADIKRMVKIINALDESISGTSTLKVFPLRFADAKELAAVIKELFTPTQQTGGQRGGGGQLGAAGFTGFGGGGAGGGFGGAGGGFGGGQGGGGGGRGNRGGGSTAANTRVVAVADERSNSLVVGAPDDMMEAIKDVVERIDQPVNDITELRVFHLINADPVEMAELLASLFPDDSRSNDPNQSSTGFRFNGGGIGGLFGQRGGGGGRNTGAAANGESDRMKKKGRVLAVPDQRTSSIIVSAGLEMMPQIAEMVAQLDSSPAKKRTVKVYSLENADPQQVEQILKNMFEKNPTANSRNGQLQQSPLDTRSRQTGTTTGNSSGSTGFGNNSGFGGGGGGGGGRGGSFP